MLHILIPSGAVSILAALSDPRFLDDAALEAAALNGDRDAFALWFERRRQLLKRIVERFGIPPGDSDDIVQEVYVQADMTISGGGVKSSLSGLVLRITRNKCIDFLRKKLGRSGNRKTTSLEDLDAQTHYEADFAEELHRSDLISRIRHEVNSLGDPCRKLITMYYLNELDYRSISEVTRFTLAGMKIRMHRCRAKLKERLGPEFPLEWEL